MSVTADLLDACQLSVRLSASHQTHQDHVHRSPFVSALAARRLPWKAYAEWLAQLYFLHESLAQAEHVMADHTFGPVLVRSASVNLPALAADLHFLYGSRWEQRIAAYPATAVYCAQLRDVAVCDPGGFVAHHCARQLQDLSAGRDLAPAMAVAYGLDSAGCRFLVSGGWDFAAYRQRCYRWVDSVPLPPHAGAALITDTARVHRMYLEVLDDLGRSWT